jgi:serine/threonine protein kinase
LGHATTPLYTAPEVLVDLDYDPTTKVDIWAAGIILYEMLTSTHPFIKKMHQQTLFAIMRADIPPKELPNELSQNTKKIIQMVLEKDPNKRPNALTLLQSKYLRPVAIELLYKIKAANETIYRVILNKNP